MRFHGMVRTDVPSRYVVDASGVDRVALICRHDDRVVAVANYDRLLEPGVAEVAFAVADDFRRRWTATRLLEQLAAIAAERGIRRFDAEVLDGNDAALGVFREAGFKVRRRGAGGEVTLMLDITPSESVWERIDERDHVGVVASLRSVLAPTSVAIVGASDAPDDPGAAVFSNVVDGHFQGVAVPINSAGGVIRSMRVATSIAELEEAPELVVTAVPPAEVVKVARQAAEKGAKALVVLRCEMGDEVSEAREWEEPLLEVVRAAGMRLVGPNCLGVLNTDPGVSLNATLAGFRVPAGRLAICSESGAIGIALLGHAAARRLGVSSFASLGQRADVSTNDLLEVWEEHSRTRVLMLYVETVGNPERFARIARRVARRKPILAIKGHRRPDAIQSEARSHTVAALRADAVVDGLLYHGGVQRFRTGEELFNAAEFYDRQSLPLGRQIGIVSNSVGVTTLAADACATRHLVVARSRGRARNPLVLHIRANPRDYARAVRDTLRGAGVDALMAFYVDPLGGDPDGVLEAISETAAGQGKPVVACVVTAEGEVRTDRSLRVPNFRFPESCADVLARAADRRAWLSRPVGEPPHYGDLDPAAARELIRARLDRKGSDGSWLASHEAEALLATHGLTYVPSHRCEDVDHAVAIAEQIGGPIALKAARQPPAYAGDIDAVLLGLEGEASVRAGWRELERRVQQTGWAMDRSDRAAADATRSRLARGNGQRSRVRAGDGGRARRPARRARRHRRLPPSSEDRCRRGRTDQGVRTGDDAAQRLSRPALPRSGRATRARTALRAIASRNAGDRRGRPQPGAVHGQRLRGARHAAAGRAPATNRARQDLVTASGSRTRRRRGCKIDPDAHQAGARRLDRRRSQPAQHADERVVAGKATRGQLLDVGSPRAGCDPFQ